MVDFSGYRFGWEHSFLNLCVLFTGISYLIRVLFSDLDTKKETADDIGRWGVQHSRSATSLD